MSDIIISILVVCVGAVAIPMGIANIICMQEVFLNILFIILILPGFIISLRRIARRLNG